MQSLNCIYPPPRPAPSMSQEAPLFVMNVSQSLRTSDITAATFLTHTHTHKHLTLYTTDNLMFQCFPGKSDDVDKKVFWEQYQSATPASTVLDIVALAKTSHARSASLFTLAHASVLFSSSSSLSAASLLLPLSSSHKHTAGYSDEYIQTWCFVFGICTVYNVKLRFALDAALHTNELWNFHRSFKYFIDDVGQNIRPFIALLCQPGDRREKMWWQE